ncbi:MAG: hypothetical protein ACRD9S_05635 [Pyrinomonadaceae bacterium]
MKKNFGKVFTLVLLAAVVCGLTYYMVAVNGKRLQGDTAQELSGQDLVPIPAFSSAVEGVEITSARVVPNSTGSLTLEVQVLNSTNNGITYLVLSSGEGSQGSGGGVVIQPYGTLTTKFPVGNLEAGKPLVVSAVAWQDGTTTGYPFQAELARKGIEQIAARAAEAAR